MGIFDGATVNTLYLVLLILGLIYAVFLLVSGQIGGDMDLDSGLSQAETNHCQRPIL